MLQHRPRTLDGMNPIDSMQDDPRLVVFRGRLGSWRIALERVRWSPQALTERYDRVARGWPRRLRRLGFDVAYADLGRRLLAWHGPLRAGARLLDCGAGSAGLSSALVAQPGAERLEPHLVDASPQMLRVADDLLRGHAIRPTLHCADICGLPYPDAHFDLVAAAHVLEHLPDPARALDEIARVLRPGGSLLLVATRHGALGRLLQWRWRIEPVTEAVVAGWLERAGLERFQAVPVAGPRWCGRLSLAFVARR